MSRMAVTASGMSSNGNMANSGSSNPWRYMSSVSDPPSVRKTVPDPAAGSGDGARMSGLRCDVLVEPEPVRRIVLRLDVDQTPVVRSETGAGQRHAVFAVAGEVEIDAAMMAEAFGRRPAVARPGDVGGIFAGIGPDAVQGVHPLHGPIAESRGSGRDPCRRSTEIPQG